MSAPANAVSSITTSREQPSLLKRLRTLSPFSRLSARFHISIGLTSLVASVTLMAIFTGLIPESRVAQLQSRIALAESITSLGSALLRNGELAGLRYSLEFIVTQNETIHAIKLKRRTGGEYQFFSPDAKPADAQFSQVITDDVLVPVLQRNRPWGELTVQYVSSKNDPFYIQYLNSRWAVLSFISLMCFPFFYIFLGKVLKELNPSTAVPSRVRSALDTIAEALLVLDVQGNIVLANAAFIELTGKTIDQLLGHSAQSLQWQDSESFVWEEALYNAEATRHDKVRFTSVDGSLKTFIINCSPVMTAEDEVGGVLISMDDITQLEKQEVLLRDSMEVAEQANNAKSTFLSTMSHEIRTPMTAILGFTEVLRRGKHQSDSERQEYLATIANSGQHLLELINDVLDLSKVESGAMDIEQLPCDCATIANDVISVMRSKADEKNIGLELDLLSSLPSQIITDPSRFRQILINLVGNAIKFTDAGQVSIKLCTGTLVGASKPCIHIDVQDSGIGMTPDQQSRIFDAFSQADSSIARRFGGTGLGLSISRQLTQAMQGELSVSSTEGEGSTFRVTLPFNTEDYQLLAPDVIRESLSTFSEKEHTVWDINTARVLVVDDGAENRQLLKIVLGDLGLDVVLASNGLEGVNTLFKEEQEGSFDVVLMDIQMPIMDGYEAATQMRKRGATLPVVALTANAMKGFEKDVLAAGFSHYMVKPIDLDKLSALLATLVGGTQRIVEAGSTRNDSTCRLSMPDSDNLPVTDASAGISEHSTSSGDLISALAADDERFIPIIEDFRDRVGQRLNELQTAVDDEDWKTLSDIGHWLKGSSASVGIDALVKPGGDLQSAADIRDAHACTGIIGTIREMQERIVANPALSRPGIQIPGDDKHLAQGNGVDASGVDQSASAPVYSSLPVDISEFHEVVGLFMGRLEERMQVLRSAVDKHNTEQISEIMHWLRGSGGNVGYDNYTTLCSRLQSSAKNSLPSMADDLKALELYNSRVFAGWALTPVPGSDDSE
ncbi:MAG: ATP-binding protein [Granulosicoccus sp.]